jgi:NIMA (never in mitosis gene a)-related kinase
MCNDSCGNSLLYEVKEFINLSPEVCQNKPYDFMSDVWALGCVLYELCCLKHAFSATNLLGLVYKIVQDKIDPIPEIYSTDMWELIK